MGGARLSVFGCEAAIASERAATMSYNYVVTAQKPTAVNACITGKYRQRENKLGPRFSSFHLPGNETRGARNGGFGLEGSGLI